MEDVLEVPDTVAERRRFVELAGADMDLATAEIGLA